MKKYIWLFLVLIIIVGLFFYYKNQTNLINKNVNNNENIKEETIIDFDSCIKAGGVYDHDDGSLASFCRINGQNYYVELPEGVVN